MCEIIEHQSEFLAISRLDPADSVCAHARGGTLNSQNSQEKQVSHSMEDIHLPADLATVQAQSVLNAFLLRFERTLSRSLAYVSQPLQKLRESSQPCKALLDPPAQVWMGRGGCLVTICCFIAKSQTCGLVGQPRPEVRVCGSCLVQPPGI